MKKELTSREKLFCAFFNAGRNGAEAAAKSGFRFPSKAAAKLLQRKDVLKELERLQKMRQSVSDDVIGGYRRLAFGCSADAIGLLFDEEITREKLDGMDLFNISEIKRQKGGALEIRFFDRLKAIDRLNELESAKPAERNELLEALSNGARALGK